MSGPNDRLRCLREAVPSVSAPGEPLSRHELAERVNDHVREQTGRDGALDANYIGKLERGVITWPREHYRAGFRAVLGAATDRDLGFSRPVHHRSAPVEGVAMDAAIRTSLGTVTTATDGRLREPNAWVEPIPATVRLEHVDAVRAAAHMFTTVDHGHGGMDVAAVAGIHLHHASRLLDLPCSTTLRPDLFTAVGWLGNVVAFAQFDAARHAEAATAFAFVLGCAEQAANWHLRAKALSGLAREAIWRGDPDAGLTYVELALVRADRLTCTERAMLLTARARALAMLGRTEETIRCVRAADEQFNRRTLDQHENPPWMAYYDSAQHLGDTGHALFDLATRGYAVAEAQQRLTGAFTAHQPGFARSRGMSGAKLATLALTTGDVDRAVEVAGQALEVLGDVHSVRVRRLVADLGTAASTQPSRVSTGLRERIHEVLADR